MTMKPEYSYSHWKTYTVHIYNNPSMSSFLLKIIYWLLFRRLDDRLNTSQSFEGISEDRVESLKSELANAYSFRVCENHMHTLFRNEILVADLPQRTPSHVSQNMASDELEEHGLRNARFMNRWYSSALSRLDEYSFELWARHEQMDEAYRLTILPSFSPASVIRTWIKDDVAKFVYKVGGGQVNCQHQLKHHTEKALNPYEWQEIHKFMIQSFWTDETWYSHYGWFVQDGVGFLFEGWYQGQYKFLDDHSPPEDATSWRAIKLFQYLASSKFQRFLQNLFER